MKKHHDRYEGQLWDCWWYCHSQRQNRHCAWSTNGPDASSARQGVSTRTPSSDHPWILWACKWVGKVMLNQLNDWVGVGLNEFFGLGRAIGWMSGKGGMCRLWVSNWACFKFHILKSLFEFLSLSPRSTRPRPIRNPILTLSPSKLCRSA